MVTGHRTDLAHSFVMSLSVLTTNVDVLESIWRPNPKPFGDITLNPKTSPQLLLASSVL
jgi:hypothetical protein